LYQQPDIPNPFMESNMKLNTFIAAALVATSSSAFAGMESGISEIQPAEGGELVLVAWDDAKGKSIVFDTGVSFQKLVDNKIADIQTVVDLNLIDPGYKSFFDNNFSNVRWNAVVASNYSDSGSFSGGNTYFGIINTISDPDLRLSLPTTINELFSNVLNNIDDMQVTAEVNAVGGPDNTPNSVNRSYRIADIADPSYMGEAGLWGSTMKGMSNISTAGLAGEKVMMVWSNATDSNFTDATTTKFANAVFDPTKNEFRVNTPLPAAAWLLMSGIAGFGAIARRRKQQA
jgi:hypothetical protein